MPGLFSRLLLAPLATSIASPAWATEDAAFHLESTAWVDSDHPNVSQTARRLVSGATNDRERAIRIHDFVRDEIRFGWVAAFWDQKASEVLASGVGYCNTKSTLMTALLRAVGIPARQVFVTLDARLLDGLIDPGTSYVDHSFVQVWIEDAWIATDSYIVDRPLARAARARLRREGRVIGYGVHVAGVSEWSGRVDAFAQFVDDGTHPNLTTRNHGVFADVGAFYRSDHAINALSGPVRLLFGLFARAANGRAEAIRADG